MAQEHPLSYWEAAKQIPYTWCFVLHSSYLAAILYLIKKFTIGSPQKVESQEVYVELIIISPLLFEGQAYLQTHIILKLVIMCIVCIKYKHR